MHINKCALALITLAIGLVSCSSPDYEGTPVAINDADYDRYFITKGVDATYLYDKIEAYGSLYGTDKQTPYDFSFAETDEWQIVKVDSDVDFYYYHNLIGWFLGVSGQDMYPELSIGVAIHKTDANQSYVSFVDPNNFWGDTEIGIFNDGTEFFIYLPEAYEPQGNLKVFAEKTSLPASLPDYFETIGFDQALLTDDSLVFDVKQILLQEIE